MIFSQYSHDELVERVAVFNRDLEATIEQAKEEDVSSARYAELNRCYEQLIVMLAWCKAALKPYEDIDSL